MTDTCSKSFHFSYPNQDVFSLVKLSLAVTHQLSQIQMKATCNVKQKPLQVKETSRFGYEKLKHFDL